MLHVYMFLIPHFTSQVLQIAVDVVVVRVDVHELRVLYDTI